VSLPQVSVVYTQSVIPISAVFFIAAGALVLPEVLREARSSRPRAGAEATGEVI